MTAFAADTESTVPVGVQELCHSLNAAARECYRLRNEALSPERAADLEAIGDVYFRRSIALLAEFES